jgi:hypothetical protein
MNICFCKHHSNCQNIDTELYGCVVCWKYKAPLTIYNSCGDRTPLTLKSVFYFLINLFKSGE